MVRYIKETSKIEFTLTGFITTVSTIMILVLGFYTYVIQPKFTYMEKRYEEQQRYILDLNTRMTKIEVSLVEIKVLLMQLEYNNSNYVDKDIGGR